MDNVKLKLRENLKKAKFEINEKEQEVMLFLLKHKYGLYVAERYRSL